MKQDHRRVSLEKHKIAYCRKIARGLIRDLSITKKEDEEYTVEHPHRLIRFAKAFLKVTKGYMRKKK